MLVPITLLHRKKNIAYHLIQDDGGSILFGGKISSKVENIESCTLHKFLTVPSILLGIEDQNDVIELIYNITMGQSIEFMSSVAGIKIKRASGEHENDWPDSNYPAIIPEINFGIQRVEEFADINAFYDRELLQGINFAAFDTDLEYFKEMNKGDEYRVLAIIRNTLKIDQKRNIWCCENQFINIVWVQNIHDGTIQAYNEC